MHGGVCWDTTVSYGQQGNVPHGYIKQEPVDDNKTDSDVHTASPSSGSDSSAMAALDAVSIINPYNVHQAYHHKPNFHQQQYQGTPVTGVNYGVMAPATQVPYTTTPLSSQQQYQCYQQYHHQQHQQQHQQHLAGFNPLTPPSTADHVPHGALSPGQAQTEESQQQQQQQQLTPRSSPAVTINGNDDDDRVDPLKQLQISFEEKSCDYLPTVLPSPKTASEHSNEDESLAVFGDDTSSLDGGARQPRQQGNKAKTFRCKQCEFVAVTKLDFWAHSKAHIKTDKILTCPKCPFVTEYKHHLEYHLRNHFGSKPFKCNKCAYSCVNKSMLNSHMKSHSNVYQFRCADCSYASKYCHSLKLHLRKYTHRPAMVLNPDGTPNPLPIIDVYGTRRGPKMKQQHTDELGALLPTNSTPLVGNNETGITAAVNANNGGQVGNPLAQIMPQLPFPYPFIGAFPNPLFLSQMAHLHNAHQLQRQQQQMQHSDGDGDGESDRDQSSPLATPLDDADIEETVTVDVALHETDAAGALDLTAQHRDTPQKSRRKGKAFKLERASVNDADPISSGNESAEDESDVATLNVVSTSTAGAVAPEREQQKKIVNNNSNNNNNEYSCQYCNIAFGDAVLYTMHMGYHGYKDPFACNMCGEACHDKVAFFLHIARTPHT